MPDEPRLRELARAAIKGEILPRDRPAKVWGGRGEGKPCAVCGIVVNGEELEFEADCERGDGLIDQHHFHVRCFAAWELERTKV